MKTQTSLIIIALVGLAVALISGSIFAYNAIAAGNQTQYNNNGAYQNMMGGYGGMGGMMGSVPDTYGPTIPPASQSPNVTQNNVFPTTYAGLTALVAAAIFGASGLAYLIKYPRRQVTVPNPFDNNISPEPTISAVAPYDSVSKTLTEEERQVLNVLSAHNGKYLQKYIRSETGLSRLKTHRIIARLAGRGIVTAEKNGNTNEIVLSDWLRQSNPQTVT